MSIEEGSVGSWGARLTPRGSRRWRRANAPSTPSAAAPPAARRAHSVLPDSRCGSTGKWDALAPQHSGPRERTGGRRSRSASLRAVARRGRCSPPSCRTKPDKSLASWSDRRAPIRPALGLSNASESEGQSLSRAMRVYSATLCLQESPLVAAKMSASDLQGAPRAARRSSIRLIASTHACASSSVSASSTVRASAAAHEPRPPPANNGRLPATSTRHRRKHAPLTRPRGRAPHTDRRRCARRRTTTAARRCRPSR